MSKWQILLNAHVTFRSLGETITTISGMRPRYMACRLHSAHAKVALRLARLRTAPGWDHVESAANPSDGGSRTGVSDPVAAALGFALVQAEFPLAVFNSVG